MLSLFELIEVSKITDTETLELIDYIKLAGNQLKATLDEYVDSLNEKHRDSPVLEAVSLKDSLQNVKQSINPLLEQTGVHWKIDFSEAPVVQFNKAYMESVF